MDEGFEGIEFFWTTNDKRQKRFNSSGLPTTNGRGEMSRILSSLWVVGVDLLFGCVVLRDVTSRKFQTSWLQHSAHQIEQCSPDHIKNAVIHLGTSSSIGQSPQNQIAGSVNSVSTVRTEFVHTKENPKHHQQRTRRFSEGHLEVCR